MKAAGYTYKRMSGNYGDYLEVETADGYKYEASAQRLSRIRRAALLVADAAQLLVQRNAARDAEGRQQVEQQRWGVRGMLYKDGTSGVGMNLGLNGGVTGTGSPSGSAISTIGCRRSAISSRRHDADSGAVPTPTP